MQQLPLDLPVRPSYAEEDFLETPANAQALALVRLWPAWPQQSLLLIGPEGSGKSHLAAIWAARAGARIFSAEQLDLSQPPLLAREKALALEDADRAPDENAFFHLLNLFAESGAPLLITARKSPEEWGLRTPDLLSRLRRVAKAEIAPPDEIFMRAILVKLFHDRQIRIDESVVDYLALRLERSAAAAQQAVAALDRAGLAEGRAVTRPLAARVLADWFAAENDADH